MDDFIIWAAGFFDGEGSISINRPSYALVVAVTGSNKSVLEMFRQRYKGYLNRISKAGKIILEGKYKSKVDCYQFIFEYDNATVFLRQVLPYLKVKKEQAELALEYIPTIKNLASLRGGRLAGKKMTGLERKARINFCKRLKTIREGSSPMPLTEPLSSPQLSLFSEN